MPLYVVIHIANPEYAGNPLEPFVPKCENQKDWAISRDSGKSEAFNDLILVKVDFIIHLIELK